MSAPESSPNSNPIVIPESPDNLNTWDALYDLGAQLRARGYNLTARYEALYQLVIKDRGNTPFASLSAVREYIESTNLTTEEKYILWVVIKARYECIRFTNDHISSLSKYRRLDVALTNFRESGELPEEHTDIVGVLELVELAAMVANLRMMEEYMGNLEAVRKHAKEYGLTQAVSCVRNAFQSRIAQLKERLIVWRRDVKPALKKAEQDLADFQANPIAPNSQLSDFTTPVKISDDIQGEECPICQQRYGGEVEALRTNACAHLCCGHCLAIWISTAAQRRSNSCPVCRTQLFQTAGDVLRGLRRRIGHLKEEKLTLKQYMFALDIGSDRLSGLLRELDPEAAPVVTYGGKPWRH